MKPSVCEQIVVELFVLGQSAQSRDALEVVRRVCAARLGSAWRLEVIDIQQQPERMRAAGIVATPTLVRRQPEPVLRTIGRLTEERVAAGLGLD